MEKNIDIAALGELLIDFTEAGTGADGMRLFEQNPGGAPANLLTVASHMGYRTEFIGKVGKDMHGAFLKKTLEKENIGVSNLIEDDHYFTTLAFVAIDENGEREFSFARKPGADTQLRAMGPKLIAVTLGSEGVLMATKEKKERMKGFSVQSVDTTGAGDSFWGGTLSAYLSLEKPIESLTWEEIHHCAVCGNATAALCVQKRGGIPAIPTKEEVEQILAEKLS